MDISKQLTDLKAELDNMTKEREKQDRAIKEFKAKVKKLEKIELQAKEIVG